VAEKKDIDFTYTVIDKLFRMSMGETGDFSGAMYNGDFSLSLEQAQIKKHRFMAEELLIGKGSRVLDMGCGWGPFLDISRTRCRRHYSTHPMHSLRPAEKRIRCLYQGCQDSAPIRFRKFGTIVSVGAFEHFCSLEEHMQGKQEAIYSQFFQTVHDLLPIREDFICRP
jgi:cyclopropane-fatty-acyl-phospholipid synthase